MFDKSVGNRPVPTNETEKTILAMYDLIKSQRYLIEEQRESVRLLDNRVSELEKEAVFCKKPSRPE